MLYVLVISRGWQRLLPPGSAQRAGVVGTIAAGLLGWLVNDSGVVVSAMVFVFVGPYLTLLALGRVTDQPELLAPLPPTGTAAWPTPKTAGPRPDAPGLYA
jgi:hypothetical protein